MININSNIMTCFQKYEKQNKSKSKNKCMFLQNIGHWNFESKRPENDVMQITFKRWGGYDDIKCKNLSQKAWQEIKNYS